MAKIDKKIEHNLKIAEPMFLYFINNMDTELSQWIHYNGVELEGSQIYFNFKSSQNSLSFKVYGGVNVNNSFFALKGKTNEVFEFFKKLKYENT
jgi:hypothetical protein